MQELPKVQTSQATQLPQMEMVSDLHHNRSSRFPSTKEGCGQTEQTTQGTTEQPFCKRSPPLRPPKFRNRHQFQRNRSRYNRGGGQGTSTSVLFSSERCELLINIHSRGFSIILGVFKSKTILGVQAFCSCPRTNTKGEAGGKKQ